MGAQFDIKMPRTMTTPEKTKLLALVRLRGAISRSPSKALTPTALRTLTKGLRDRNVEVADLAAAVIEDLGEAGKPLIPALVRALKRRPRYAFGESLAGVGIVAVPALLRLVADRDSRVRRIAAWALGCPGLVRDLLGYAASDAHVR